MNLADVRAELEDELTWRSEEIRFFHNRLSELRNDDERDRYRRAMVVMLYAHFEGFWKSAFTIYVKTVNSLRLQCRDATAPLVAASFSDLFESLADGSKKSDYFRNTAPDDTKLHRFCRHSEFAGRFREFELNPIEIQAELVVDTESNLKPTVIRKNLFRLGFEHDAFKDYEGTVNWLLNSRNNIAHGATRSGVSKEDYDPLEVAVFDVMRTTIRFIYDALKSQRYLRHRAPEYAI